MKNIFKTMIVAAALLFSGAALANDCSLVERISGLDEVSKRAMIVQCEQTKLETQQRLVKDTIQDVKPTGEKVLDTMDRVSIIAKQFAEAVTTAAKGLGVAVNEFITTPAGLMTVAFIIYQMAGHTIVYLVLAGVAVAFIFRTIRRFLDVVTIESYTEETYRNIFGQEKTRKVPVRTPWKNMEDGQLFWTILLPIAECVTLIVILLNIPA